MESTKMACPAEIGLTKTSLASDGRRQLIEPRKAILGRPY
jgi:hypothetical protein